MKKIEPNIYDIQFLEASLDIEKDKLDAVLKFIVDEGLGEPLVSYLDAWVEKDHEKVDYESVSDIVQRIEKIESK